MTQDDNKLQSAAQVLHCILQAAEHLRSKAVTRYTDDKQIVWSLVENKLDWYTGVGTAEHDGKWTLFGYARAARHKAQVARIDGDDLLYHTTRVV
jgi:hypothetical protein